MQCMEPPHWLTLSRTVRLGETDAAGVMHFHQLLRWCHEAYEESLERFGIPAAAIFPTGLGPDPEPSEDAVAAANQTAAGRPIVALPIIHCQADYRAPLVCGSRIHIRLTPRRLDASGFEVAYHTLQESVEPAEVARALSRHLAIDSRSRRRCLLPDPISRWLEASSLGRGVQPL